MIGSQIVVRTSPLSLIGERRSAQRYPGTVVLRYRLRESTSQSGLGILVNLSTAGVLFQTEDRLGAGSAIELFIPWPLRSIKTISVELYISGRVVRTETTSIAVELDHYEFRVKNSRLR